MTSPPHEPRRLALFQPTGHDRGRPWLVCVLWVTIGQPAVASRFGTSAFRIAVLRLFGANVGRDCLVHAGVRVHWPWKLTIGHSSQLAWRAWILNLEPVRLGDRVRVGPESVLCTGSHDRKDPLFRFNNAPITVGNDAVVEARATVLKGVVIGHHATVRANGLVYQNLPDGSVVPSPETITIDHRRRRR